jgi:hypothetical protein
MDPKIPGSATLRETTVVCNGSGFALGVQMGELFAEKIVLIRQ